ncbi:MAG: hypothetical protein U0270_07370 [Labilithrix sp.]
MSFVLPGNQRQLRFTGEAKALKDESSSGGPGAGLALGKPRVRKATTPPPALVPAASARPNRNTGVTPASPGQSNPGSISRPGSYQPSVRGVQRIDTDRSWDGDDHASTMAFDREGADVMPGAGPNSMRPTMNPPPRAVSVAPIPHFRPANPAVQTVIVPNQTGSMEARSGKGAPLALWIFAAILAGILSYHVTPAVMTHFEGPPPPPAKVGG